MQKHAIFLLHFCIVRENGPFWARKPLKRKNVEEKNLARCPPPSERKNFRPKAENFGKKYENKAEFDKAKEKLLMQDKIANF